MSLQVEKLEHNMAKLTIEVAAEEVEKALQAAYLKQRGKINIPGFRKGKVPRQMIEKMYGAEIFYDEAANKMISEAYGKAYDECELDIVSQPSIDIVQLEKGKDFIFTAEVATKPEVKLGEYKGLKVDKYSTRVTQKEVDEEIEKERERNARTVEVTDRAVEDKDIVTLDFEGFVDGVAFEGGKGTDYPLTIGSGSFIPGFEEQLIGAEIDKEVEVKVTFPEEYQAAELAGKDAVFKCTVHAIKAKELPEADDEFASEVSECETMEAYRAEVKQKIKDRKESEGKAKKEDQAVEQAIENAEMDIPQPMIDLQVRQMADDFLAKPFGMEVVVAKIQAVLRRSYAFVSEKALCCVGNVTLDLTEAVLHYKEKELKLSGNEFGILKILMKNPKRPVSREELMRSLWESEHFIDDNTLTVNVTRLRKKLEEIGLCEFIKTRKGIGYQIREEQVR